MGGIYPRVVPGDIGDGLGRFVVPARNDWSAPRAFLPAHPLLGPSHPPERPIHSHEHRRGLFWWRFQRRFSIFLNMQVEADVSRGDQDNFQVAKQITDFANLAGVVGCNKQLCAVHLLLFLICSSAQRAC